ncbi:HD-GYP domain-containing protein [Desulfocurvus sp. DL9XJH121]
MRPEHDASLLEKYYTSISTLMLVPGRQSGFIVHVLRDGKFEPYAEPDENLTPAHRSALSESGVDEVYVHRDQESLLRDYLSGVLGDVLQDASAPEVERARALRDAALCIALEALRTGPPSFPGLDNGASGMQAVLARAVDLLARGGALDALSRLVAHDYRTFVHSVHVFLYSTALLRSCGLPPEALAQAGAGALLHDVGKALIPHEILCATGALPLHELSAIRTHPDQGLALCGALPPATGECILLHHEKLDGCGYPGGLRAEEIPLHMRAVTIADIYDAMTSDRPYCKAINPFLALRVMRDEMFREIDQSLFQRFTRLFSTTEFI